MIVDKDQEYVFDSLSRRAHFLVVPRSTNNNRPETLLGLPIVKLRKRGFNPSLVGHILMFRQRP